MAISKPGWLAVLVVGLGIALAHAQEIPDSVVGSGGERLTGGGLVLTGTVGQAAIGEMAGDSFLHQAGYWYLPSTTITAAYLSWFAAAREGNVVVVSWALHADSPGDGFHVWREEPERQRFRVSQQPLSGPRHFEFVDPAPPVGQVAYWLQEAGGDGIWFGPARLPALPLRFGLEPNRPNPFNPRTSVCYSLPKPTVVRLAVFDVGGHRVRTLVAGNQPGGLHTVVWDGRDDAGLEVASGAYFARLETTLGQQTRKMLLAR